MQKVLIVGNSSWSLLNFRSNLIKELILSGYTVIVAAPHDNYTEKLKGIVSRYVPIEINNTGINPFSDIKLFMRLYGLFF